MKQNNTLQFLYEYPESLDFTLKLALLRYVHWSLLVGRNRSTKYARLYDKNLKIEMIYSSIIVNI